MTLVLESSLDKYVLLQFKNGLREQQRWLVESIAEAEKTIRGLGDSGPDGVGDTGSTQCLEISPTAQYNENRNRLRLVDVALERIRAGTFGTCAECGEAIGLKRLQVEPWRSHCIQCQERHEQRRVPDLSRAPEIVPA